MLYQRRSCFAIWFSDQELAISASRLSGLQGPSSLYILIWPYHPRLESIHYFKPHPTLIPIDTSTSLLLTANQLSLGSLKMDSQNIEFTVEQLLDLHRYWITELWLVDKKSEEEIVTLLHRNQIDVTCVCRSIFLSTY